MKKQRPPTFNIEHIINLVSWGAFLSGIYQGLTETKGIFIDSTLKDLIRYGPICFNGLLGLSFTSILINNSTNLDNLVSGVSSESYVKRGVDKKYASIIFPISIAVVTTGFEYVGYLFGKAMEAIYK